MIDTSKLRDDEFEEALIELIGRELGAGGLARFMTMFCSVPGKDYTRDKQLREDAERKALVKQD
jgi:hypothetical protein